MAERSERGVFGGGGTLAGPAPKDGGEGGFCPLGHLAKSGDIAIVTNAAGVSRVEAGDTAVPSAAHRMAPHNQELPGPLHQQC